MAEQKTGLPDANEGAQFPSDLLDPAVKESADYALKYSKAAYSRHKLDGGYFSLALRNGWIENRLYAKGNQPVSKYATKFSKLKNATGHTLSYLDLDHRIVPILPKIRDIVLSYMAKMDVDVYVDAINPKASKQREAFKNNLRTKAKLKPFYDELAAKAQAPELGDVNDEYVPESVEETEMYTKLNFRLPEEIAYEIGLRCVFNENDWGECAGMVREDIFDCGVAFGSEYIDRTSNKIKMRYEDPVNGIFQNFRGHNGTKGMSRIGVIRKMTIAALKLEAGNQFTEETYWQLAKTFEGWWSNPATVSAFSDYTNTDSTNVYMEYDNCEVLVQELEWDSIDRYKFERKPVEKMGEVLTFTKPFKTKLGKEEVKGPTGETLFTKEVFSRDVKAIYTAKWIIGTDYVYDYGKAKNIARKNDVARDPQKKFKLYRITTSPMGGRCNGFVDSIQLSWLKMQNLKARAMPKGLIIDIGAFENVFLDNKKMSARELLEMAVQTGIIITRRKSTFDDEGEDANSKPIEETVGGLGKEFAELNESIRSDIEMIQQITGVNSAMDASSPDPSQLVGVQKIALTGAQNALFPMLSGYVKFLEQMSIGVILHLMLLAKHKKLECYRRSLGDELCDIMEIAAEYSDEDGPSLYDMRIEGRPSADQKQRLFNMIQTALASSQDPNGGGIELQHAMELDRYVESNYPPKFIEAVLDYRLSQYKKKHQQMAIESSNAASQATAAQKKQADMDELNKEREKSRLRMEEYTHKTNEDIRKEKETQPLKAAQEVVAGEVQKDAATHEANLEVQKN